MGVQKEAAMRGIVGMYVHGLNLNDPEWNRIVWGEAPEKLGRVPRAMLLLKEEYPHATRVLFGSGASEKNGVKEGAYTIQYLFDNWHRLRNFDAFRQYSRLEMALFRWRVKKLVEPEIASQNTITELEHGIPRLMRFGVRRIVLVTELTHISRALAHGGEVLERMRIAPEGVHIVGEHSDVMPTKVQPSQVVVFEPRADGQNQIAHQLRRVFRIPGTQREEFSHKLDSVLKDMGV